MRAFLLFILWITFSAAAADEARIVYLSPNSRDIAHNTISKYMFDGELLTLVPGRTAVGTFSGTISALSTLEAYLAHPYDYELEKRMAHALEFIIGAGFTGALVLTNAGQQEELRAHLEPFLRHYAVHEAESMTHEGLIREFTGRGLWSANELWFAAQNARDVFNLYYYFDIIMTVGSQLSPEQLTELKSSLGAIRPYDVLALIAEYKLGIIQPHELVHLLRTLQHRFDPTKKQGATEELMEIKVSLTREAIPVLEDLQRRYNNNEKLVVDAVTKAAIAATTANEIHFYEMFKEKEFVNLIRRFDFDDVKDPLEFRKKTDINAADISSLILVKDRSENVLTVDFGGQAILCRALFRKSGF